MPQMEFSTLFFLFNNIFKSNIISEIYYLITCLLSFNESVKKQVRLESDILLVLQPMYISIILILFCF